MRNQVIITLGLLIACILLLLGLLTGCASIDNLADTLNKRSVQSCISFAGTYGLWVGVHGVIATGGANMEDCVALR